MLHCLFLKKMFSLHFPFQIVCNSIWKIATLFISTTELFSKLQEYIRVHNYSSLEVIAGDTKNRTQTIIHVQIKYTMGLWKCRVQELGVKKEIPVGRYLSRSILCMSRKDAKGDSLASAVHSILSNYFLFGFPAKFKHIVTSDAILRQSRTSSFFHLEETNYKCTFCFYMAPDFIWGKSITRDIARGRPWQLRLFCALK